MMRALLPAGLLLPGYGLLALLSMLLSREAGDVAYVWLPNALALALLLRNPPARWPGLLGSVLVAATLANHLNGDHWTLALGLALVNGVELLLAGLLARSLPVGGRSGPPIQRILHLFTLYLAVAAVVGAALGGWLLQRVQGVSFLPVAVGWWLGEAVGLLLLGVPALLLRPAHLAVLKRPGAVLDFLVTFAILLVLTHALLQYIAFPFVFITVCLSVVAFRDGALRASLHGNLILVALITGHLLDWVDLFGLLAAVGYRGVWAAVALTSLFPTLLGLAVENLHERQAEVGSLTERLQLATGSIGLGVWDWDLSRRALYLDEQTQALYDVKTGQIQGGLETWLVRVHPDDRARAEQELREALAGSGHLDTEYRIQRPDGSTRFLHVSALLVRDRQGQPQRMVGLNWDVSRHKQADLALREAQALLQGVIGAAGEFSIIATDVQGIITLFSIGAERMLGYRADELVGRSSPAPLHVAEEVEARGLELSAEYGRPIAGFDVFVENARHFDAEAREWTYVRKDGSRLPVRLVVSAIRNADRHITGYLGVAQDITAEKQAQQTLVTTNRVLEHQISVAQRARQEFESLFALAPGALLVVDAEGRIIKANAQAHDLFGYPPGSLADLSIEELIPREHRGVHVAQRNQYMKAPAARLKGADRVLSGLRRDGTRFLGEVTLSPLLINGAPCTIAIVRDVTVQKQTEQALALAKEQAEAASRAKSEFVANMSHEIRTPLNAVLGTAQLLEKLDLNEQQQRYVDMIRSAGQSLLGILNDILDFSKIEAGRMELAQAEFSLDDVLANIGNLMAVSAGDKDIELAIGVAPGTPTRYRGDALRLQQILVNLVGNAIKFTERGEVVVEVELVSRQEQQGLLRCRVRDTGIGMTEEQQARLFTAFSQADTSMTRRFGGTGLGLVICRRLIELMQGDIHLHSRSGEGTEFQFTLTLDLVDAPPAPPALTQRVLVVDDNATTRRFLTDLVQAQGGTAHSVESVAAALEKLHASPAGQPRYDALLVDWKLPGQDALARLPGTPLPRRMLMVSAYGRARLHDSGLPWDALLVKPVTACDLRKVLGNAAAPRHDSPSPEADPRLAGVRLLLVEDNPLNQTVACGLLEQLGALVDVMQNGREAVDWLHQHADQYRLVLMDVQMPVMDGFTATRLIRSELHLTLPVIAMSAGVTRAERQQCLDSGMNDFIPKPIDYEQMRATLLRHLGHPVPPAPAPVPADSAAPASDIFAPERLLSYVRGKPERRRDILDQIQALVDAGIQPVAQGRQLLAGQQFTEAARHFHSLKGSMGNLGAQRVWAAAERLEKAIKTDAQTHWPALLQDLEACLRELVAVARQWLDEQPECQPPPPCKPDLAQWQRLRQLLEEQDIAASDLYARLRAALPDGLPAASLEQADRAMQRLDFAAARQLLERLWRESG